MNTATHSVVVPFPQAFASPLTKSSPFPSAPRYGACMSTREDNRSLDGYSAPFGIIRPSLLLVLWLVRSCFYLQERFTVEPANMIQLSKYYRPILSHPPKSGNGGCPCTFLFIPGMNTQGFLKRIL
jgi:hypothetical protein